MRRTIGYVGQGNGAGHNQRVRDELRTQGAVFGLDRQTARRRADELLDALDLASLAGRKVSSLSGGQRRRLDVAIGLVHAPSHAVPRRALHRARPAEPGQPLGATSCACGPSTR